MKERFINWLQRLLTVECDTGIKIMRVPRTLSVPLLSVNPSWHPTRTYRYKLAVSVRLDREHVETEEERLARIEEMEDYECPF